MGFDFVYPFMFWFSRICVLVVLTWVFSMDLF